MRIESQLMVGEGSRRGGRSARLAPNKNARGAAERGGNLERSGEPRGRGSPRPGRARSPFTWNCSRSGFIPHRAPFIFLTAFGLVLTLAIAIATGQPAMGNSVKGFSAPLEYFDPPHELQVRSYIEATESEMGLDGTVILHNAKLQRFHEDGSREMIMNAPQCFYDYGKHIVRSSGPLQVQTWDEGHKRALQLQGSNGFYWQQTNSLLIVSNQQMTTISGALTNSFNP